MVGLKRIMVLVLTALMVILASGCPVEADPAQDPVPPVPAEPQPVEGTFRVALLVPSTVTDRGWSQIAYEALLQIEEELGAEISYTETGNFRNKADVAARYAEEGYHLILGHGFQYSEPFLQVSPLYPETVFVTAGGEHVTANQLVLENQLEQVTYVAGAITARLTQTRKVACVGGVEIPSVVKTFEAFRRGIHSVDPGVRVTITYLGSWDNLALGYEESLRLIDEGNDVLYPNANALGLGVIKAADERGVYVFGQSVDQSDLSPDYMVASMTEDHVTSYLKIARQVQEGTYEPGRRVQHGLAEGASVLVWNPRVLEKMPPEIPEMQRDLEARIKAGGIYIPSETEV